MKNKKSLKELTVAELDNQVAEFKKEKFNFRAQTKAGQNENPAKMKELRRNIARALTEKRRRALTVESVAPAAN